MKEHWNKISDYWKDILIAHVRLNYFNGCNGWIGDMKDGDIDIFEEYQMEFKKSFKRNETDEEIEKVQNLKHLRIQMLGLNDLSPLKYLDLESIQAYSNNLSDISVFSQLPNLNSVDISGNNISDLSPLKYCTKIAAIDLSSNPIPEHELNILPESTLVHSYNLGQQETDDYWELKKEVNIRRIDNLIHFTPTINLYSILENGELMSRTKLESLDIEQFDILDYVQFTDDIRYDDKNYINLSLSSPNTYLLSKFKEKTKNDPTITWCILKIEKKFIFYHDTLFSVTNAASNAAKRQFGITGDLEKFRMLFKEQLNINTFNGVRSLNRNGVHPKYPTDVQAEILVRDSIPSESIIEVCFESEEKLAEAKAAMSSFDTSNFVVDKEIFSPNRSK
jgi:hypothetical protein